MNYRFDLGFSAFTFRAKSATAISMQAAIETRRCSARKRRSSIVACESRTEVWSFATWEAYGGSISECNITPLDHERDTLGATEVRR